MKSLRTIASSRRIAATTLGSIAAVGMIGTGVASTASASSNTASTLAAIKYCESGNSYSVVNSIGAGGAYQFLPSTWHGLGYSGLPQNASPATQDAAAIKLYNQVGTSPWVSSQHCWSSKVGTIKPSTSSTTTPKATATSTTKRHQVSRSAIRSLPVTKPTQTASSSTMPATAMTTAAQKSVSLNAAETAALDAITKQQKDQPTWTPRASKGMTVTRYNVQASGLSVYTHDHADFTSTRQDVLSPNEALVGHYLNTDWFAITSGAHAGQFVSTATLNLHPTSLNGHHNGQLTTTQLTTLPSWLSADGDQLNPTVAKQLILMNAAFRADTGMNLTVTQGYRTLAEQQHLRSTLGASMTSAPGDSNHGLGEAIDLATSSTSLAWLKANATNYGFGHPDNINAAETWHWDAQG